MADRNRTRNAFRLSLAAAAFVLAGTGAQAQLLGRPLPGIGPTVGGIGNSVQNTLGGVNQTVNHDLDSLNDGIVRDAVGRPLSAIRRLERDPLGAPIVRGEIVAISPAAASLAIAHGLSFDVKRTETVGDLGLTIVVLEVPDGLSPGAAIAKLRAADPQGQYDFNHIYNPGGTLSSAPGRAAGAALAPQRIGMIDGGVDRMMLHGPRLEATGFVGNCRPVPSDHGTAVAAILAGQSETRLFAADVFCGKAEGGSAETIVRALGWMAASGVPVVNISLAGPPNVLLAAGVQSFVARGHVLVAAAGNDGPAAPPRFPAAYPGVIAVTSVDDNRRVEIDANQGPYIAFAARGVRVAAPKAGGGRASYTGTSFAAPVVARRFAWLMEQPDPARAAWAFCVMRRNAQDLGPPGRDPVFGFGFVDDTMPPAAAACGTETARQ